ncbi:MAG: hypothetical protein JWO26_1332, partial [Rhodospirillales bacterium]|nr:hypothetical protein [Rhodospirillales bacterium]
RLPLKAAPAKNGYCSRHAVAPVRNQHWDGCRLDRPEAEYHGRRHGRCHPEVACHPCRGRRLMPVVLLAAVPEAEWNNLPRANEITSCAPMNWYPLRRLRHDPRPSRRHRPDNGASYRFSRSGCRLERDPPGPGRCAATRRLPHRPRCARLPKLCRKILVGQWSWRTEQPPGRWWAPRPWRGLRRMATLY